MSEKEKLLMVSSMAMQGLLAGDVPNDYSAASVAKLAVKYAVALMAALEDKPQATEKASYVPR